MGPRLERTRCANTSSLASSFSLEIKLFVSAANPENAILEIARGHIACIYRFMEEPGHLVARQSPPAPPD